MPITPQPMFYLLINGRAKGPFEPQQVQQLIDAGNIGRETRGGATPEGPWERLDMLAGSGLSFESAPGYAVANRSSAPKVDHRDLIAAANQPSTRPPRAAAPPAPAPTLAPPDENDTYALLALNREREIAHGIGDLKPFVPVKSRRARDFVILVFAGLFAIFGVLSLQAYSIGGVGAVAQMFTSPIILFGLGMSLFYVAGVAWILFGILDKY